MNCNMPGFPVLYYLWVCSNSCPWSWLCHLTNSSFIIPFCSCPQSFPASESFLVSQLFASGGQSIGALASASVLPMYIQGWFPLGLTGLISLLSMGFLRVFSNTTVWKHQFFWCSAFFMVQFSHLYLTTGKTMALSAYNEFHLFPSNLDTLSFSCLITVELPILLNSSGETGASLPCSRF